MEIHAQNVVITTPNKNTAPITTNITPGVITASKSGSYRTSAYAAATSIPSAITPARIPTHTLRTKKDDG